ncbi:MAG: aminotransferase class I/II-fold pyridoxal phosphate-dependent enzyme [Erysipelotrichaceae bacterium]|nr:aminotransferase class I/II-fold pyridoxal phosphate-dependent enzyme [Erysipelotrichaceae bacterium]
MFFSGNRDLNRYIDTIFPVTNACAGDDDPSKINATIGSFYTEDNKLMTFDSVYKSFRSLGDDVYARYAKGSFGNPDFNEAITRFVLEGKVKHHRVIPVPGGTGAISTGVGVCLERGDTIIIPEVAWGNYRIIASEFSLKVLTYDAYDLEDMFAKIDEAERVFLVINSPCQNPCGLSYTYEQWKMIIDYLNSCGKEAMLMIDVAYIDFAYNDDYKKYFELFNELNDNVLVMIAYSCSKAFSYYGMRLGALFAIQNDEEFLDLFINQCARRARTTFSSVSNSAMTNVADVLNAHLDEYLAEKEDCKRLLKERSYLFIKECDENGLEYYPYHDGFFVTLRFSDNRERDRVHQNFLDDHVYCIKVNKGIRVGICAIPVERIKGLAKRLKALY